MAGKHSKTIFDFGKNVYTVKSKSSSFGLKALGFDTLSLPFKIILSVLVVSLVLSSVFVGGFFMQSSSHKKLLQNAKKTFYSSENPDETLEVLAQKNSDIIGWLKADGTNIDCAVCQGEDNSFYINHNQLGKKSRYGALFLQGGENFERTGDDNNIVIFGNNMKDGTMFGSLKKYRNINFYKNNPFVNLYYGDKSEIYVVFAVMLVSASSGDEEVYKPYKSHFVSDKEFDLWRKETLSRNMFVATTDVKADDKLLTLVTVADDFDDARLVVMAKQISEWDALHIDISGAAVNPKTKYPKVWYTTRGLEYPY